MAAPPQPSVNPRRLAATAASLATSGAGAGVLHRTEKRDWSLLAPDAVREIADRLLAADVTEYIRLRAVCQRWRRSTVDPRLLHPRFFPRNWLMLQDKDDDDEEEDVEEDMVVDAEEGCRFVNVRTGATLRIRLPPVEEYGEVLTTGGAEGLLLFHCERTDTVRLFNPLTRAMAVLPGRRMVATESRLVATTFSTPVPACFISAGVVFDGDSPNRPTVLLIRSGVSILSSMTLLYAKPGDDGWGTVDISCALGDGDRFFHGGMSFQGQFYASTRHGDLLKVVLAPRPHLVYVARHHNSCCTFRMAVSSYLVPSLDDVDDAADNNDGMLLVRCYGKNEQVDVFGVHLGRGTFTPLLVLGNRAIFLPSVTLRADKFPFLVDAVYQQYENIEDFI